MGTSIASRSVCNTMNGIDCTNGTLKYENGIGSTPSTPTYTYDIELYHPDVFHVKHQMNGYPIDWSVDSTSSSQNYKYVKKSNMNFDYCKNYCTNPAMVFDEPEGAPTTPIDTLKGENKIFTSFLINGDYCYCMGKSLEDRHYCNTKNGTLCTNISDIHNVGKSYDIARKCSSISNDDDFCSGTYNSTYDDLLCHPNEDCLSSKDEYTCCESIPTAQLDPVNDLKIICSTDHAYIKNTVQTTSQIVYTCECNQHYELWTYGQRAGVNSWEYIDHLEGSNSSDDNKFTPGSVCMCISDECDDPGCPDTTACNYNPQATIYDYCYYANEYYNCAGNCTNDSDGDGVCDELEIAGCRNYSACNHNPQATDDGSCTYPAEYYDCGGKCLNDRNNNSKCDELEVAGCTDINACNYNETAEIDDTSCNYPPEYYDCFDNCLNDINNNNLCDEFDVPGCTDATACNNNINATIDDKSCIYPESGKDCDGNCVVGDIGCGCGEPGPSGCDNQCGSTAVEDDCGVCDGDGSSCKGICKENQYVSNHTCQDCSIFTRKKAGDLASGKDTSCVAKHWIIITVGGLGGMIIGFRTVYLWMSSVPQPVLYSRV